MAYVSALVFRISYRRLAVKVYLVLIMHHSGKAAH